MQPRAPIATDLVLLGAGHAHVEVLRRFAMRPEPGVRLTLIGREPETPYTGMLPGLIRGDYTFEQVHIDLAPLAASAGARLILTEATAIDLADRRVTVIGRPDVPFDLLSIDVGGEPAMPPGAGVPVKPIGQFLARLSALEATLQPGARIAVVGGGAGGTELALALARRYRERVRIVLVCDTPEPLASAPPFARRVARAALVDAGMELACGVQAGAWADGRLALSDGSFLEVGTALWATGVVGPAFLAASGLACDAAGCARVDCDAAQRQSWLRLRRRRLCRHRGQSAAEVRRLGGACGRAAGGQSASRGARADAAPLATAIGRAGDPRPRRWACAGVAQRRRGRRARRYGAGRTGSIGAGCGCTRNRWHRWRRTIRCAAAVAARRWAPRCWPVRWLASLACPVPMC